jgi:hypothetical protein
VFDGIALLDGSLALLVAAEEIDIGHPIGMAVAVDSPQSHLASAEVAEVPGLQIELVAAVQMQQSFRHRVEEEVMAAVFVFVPGQVGSGAVACTEQVVPWRICPEG